MNIKCGDIEVGLEISLETGCKVGLNTKSKSSFRIESLMQNAYYINKTDNEVSLNITQNTTTIDYAELKHGRKAHSKDDIQTVYYNTVIGTK